MIDRERLAALAADIRGELPAKGNFNLVVAVVPPADATRAGETLGNELHCPCLDYDARVLELMAAGDWPQFLIREQTGLRQPVHRLFKQVASEAGGMVCAGVPTVVHNVNLPVTWDYPGFASDFYQLSSEGVVVLVVGGSGSDPVRLHHKLVVPAASLAYTIDLTL